MFLNWVKTQKYGITIKENVLNTLNVLVDINSFLTKNNIKLNILIVPNIWYFKDEGLEFKKEVTN